jgi:uncharacterized membrane protein YphA (DoxX/SURF4 family)
MFDVVTKDTVAPLLLRLAVGAFFIVHGIDKVSAENERGRAWANKMDDPPSATFQVATAWGELAAGAMLAVGFFTRPTSLVAAGLTVVLAAGGVPIDVNVAGPALVKGEAVYNIVLLGACAALVFLGGGTVALDQTIRWWRNA